MADTTTLPDALRNALADIGPKLEAGRKIERDISGIASLFVPIKPSDLPQAENEIVAAASLYRWRREWSVIEKFLNTRVSDAAQLAVVNGLEYVFIFHRDGRLREAALRKISEPLPNPFLFAAIAWRLNDWAAPVRQAAVDCAARTFPETSPEIVAEAGMTLLTRQATWGRWGSERALWDAAISRSDVAQSLARLFATRTTGPMASLLRQALRSESMDEHLDYLAHDAVQPAVRATAIQSLVNGYTEWPNGWRWRWIDKSMGVRRRETEFARRGLATSTDTHGLIRRSLNDRAAAVRNVAISGLIQNQADMPDARQLAATMLADRSAAVRERAEFIINRNLSQPETTSGE